MRNPRRAGVGGRRTGAPVEHDDTRDEHEGDGRSGRAAARAHPRRNRARRVLAFSTGGCGVGVYARGVDLRFQTVGLGRDAVDYLAAWELQREVHRGVVAGGPEHRAAARAPARLHRRASAPSRTSAPLSDVGVPVVDVDRGGKITFHGPGQLVGYPIVRLAGHVNVVDYVRRLEEALIHTCTDFGVRTARVPGRSGVWLPADDRGSGAEDRRDRHPGLAARGHARVRAELRRRPRRGTNASSRAASRRRRHLAERRARPRRARRRGRSSSSRHLRELLAWEPYERDPRLRTRVRSPAGGRRMPRRAACPGAQSAVLTSVCGRVVTGRPTA